MESLFEQQGYQIIQDRLDKLSPDQPAKWGKMDVAQMLHHCQKAFEIPLGISTIKPPGGLMKLAFKVFKKTLYNDKPWGKGMRTAPEFLVKDAKVYETEKSRLLELAAQFHEKGKDHNWPIHPAFGKLTSEQWGKMQYKHLDHHLRQFGV
ncbi:DUF1569 domain-containing protein [Aureitalea marina]|uniref:DUF1569 domain-containing protein n=1 Tax=Aureitalea marina TaxID=930804 RepID=A0A2S7KQR6_9FLAO|nr:DUF1569 domain-containing protein [Aureitalea marina]PQB04961.1 hypothetical protein BST85_08695 [Aureitalea marina]